jgi:hypothetical protein
MQMGVKDIKNLSVIMAMKEKLLKRHIFKHLKIK